MNQTKRSMEYTTPKVELLDVRVERGFAGSGQLQSVPTMGNSNEAYGAGTIGDGVLFT